VVASRFCCIAASVARRVLSREVDLALTVDVAARPSAWFCAPSRAIDLLSQSGDRRVTQLLLQAGDDRAARARRCRCTRAHRRDLGPQRLTNRREVRAWRSSVRARRAASRALRAERGLNLGRTLQRGGLGRREFLGEPRGRATASAARSGARAACGSLPAGSSTSFA
jgi:hypothetical protein